jgi:uncharacterized protein YfkK (UPF0435 family)
MAAATSKTHIKHKLLSIHEKLDIVNVVHVAWGN